nr:hypothetical protein Iba_chr04cCG14380 [Ipomoea batatas]
MMGMRLIYRGRTEVAERVCLALNALELMQCERVQSPSGRLWAIQPLFGRLLTLGCCLTTLRLLSAPVWAFSAFVHITPCRLVRETTYVVRMSRVPAPLCTCELHPCLIRASLVTYPFLMAILVVHAVLCRVLCGPICPGPSGCTNSLSHTRVGRSLSAIMSHELGTPSGISSVSFEHGPLMDSDSLRV